MVAQSYTREERSTYLGASDIPVIFGLSKFRNAMDLLKEKKGIPSIEDSQESAPIVWGNYLEDTIAQLAERELDFKLRRERKRAQHKQLPFLSCQIDRAVEGQPTLKVEIKTTTSRTYNQWEDEKHGVPMPYYLQVQTQMACKPAVEKTLIIAAVLDQRKLHFHWIERNDEDIEIIEKEADYFWNECVLGDAQPRFMQAADYRDTYFKRSGAQMCTEEFVYLAHMLKKANHHKKELEEVIDGLQRKVMAVMGDAEEVINESNVWLARFKPQSRASLDTTRLRKENPEIYNQYLKPVEEKRVLRFNYKSLPEESVVLKDFSETQKSFYVN